MCQLTILTMMMVTPWLLILLIQLNFATAKIPPMMEEEFIADYLDAFDNLHPTFLVRTDVPGFAEFSLAPNETLYSSIYYEESDIEALAERVASLVVMKDYLYGHNAVFFIGIGHGRIIQVFIYLNQGIITHLIIVFI